MALRRIPSRRMHALPELYEPASPAILAILVVFLVAFGWACWSALGTVISCTVLAVLGVFTFLGVLSDRRYFRRLRQERSGENICSFVRAFEYREVDTWILRSVYEQTTRWIESQLPLRPGDRLVEDLRIDPEDLNDLGEEIARFAQRSFDDEHCNANPFQGRIATVADLVDFFSHQPRINVEGRTCI